MVELLEYQAKELFKQVGIPTLPSQVIREPRELRQLDIPYPIVVKSQVKASGRAKAGGIRFAENTIDAIAAASTILNLEILGQFPEVVLAEARYNTERELFLAIALDCQEQCPVLLGSCNGGINLDSLFANLQMIAVKDEYSPYYARQLSRQMGLEGKLVEAVSEIITKMYLLFVQKDLDLIEINPLGVSMTGGVMALDGKIKANDAALGRHRELIDLSNTNLWPNSLWLSSKSKKAKIGVICSDVDLAMASLDLYSQQGVETYTLVLASEREDFALELHQAIAQLTAIDSINTIFLNLLHSDAQTHLVTEVVSNFLQPVSASVKISEERGERATGVINRRPLISPKSGESKSLNFVLRLLIEIKCDISQVYGVESLETGVNKTIALAKP